jgi:uncharacterized membrane protein YkvA (DUF1232 family)
MTDLQSKTPSAPDDANPLTKKASEEPKRLTQLRSRAEGLLSQPSRLKDTLSKIKQKESSRLNLSATDAKETIVLLSGLVRDFVDGRYRDIAPDTIIAALAALLYFLLPLDAIPDFILALGMIDDFAILAWVARHFREELDRYRDWQMSQPNLETESKSTQNPGANDQKPD